MKTSRRHPSHQCREPGGRRGVTLIEMTVCAVLFGVALSVGVPMLRSIQRSARMNEQHRIATAELATLMEQTAALPAGDVTAETIAALKLSAVAARSLPEAAVVADVADADPLRRVTLALSWQDDSGVTHPPVRLTAWLTK